MGAVGQTIFGGRGPDGYPMGGTVYYVYCDKCGSFNIKTDVAIEKLVTVAAAVLGAAAVWNHFARSAFSGSALVVVWVFFLALAFAIFGLGSPYVSHRCRTCGNMDITRDDVLDYAANDTMALDVPERLVHKHNTNEAWYEPILVILTGLIVMLLFPFAAVAVICWGLLDSLVQLGMNRLRR